MQWFTHRQRVVVTSPHHALTGRTGTVHRLRRADNGAWVRMDEDLPEDLVLFTDADDPRHRDVCLYPEQCAPADEVRS